MSNEQPVSFKKSNRHWLILVCSCFLTGVGFALPMTCFSIFIRPLVGELGTQVTQIALYFTFIGIGAIISSFVAPRFMKTHAKPLVVASAIIMGLSYIALAMMPSVPLVWVVGLLCGLCYPVCSVLLVPIMLNNWFFKNQGTFVGIALAMIGIFGVVFSPVLTAIIQSAGWQTAMIVMAVIIMAVIGIIGLFFLQMSPIPLGILPYGAEQSDVEAIVAGAAANKKGPNPNLPGLVVKEIVRTPGFYILALACICIGVVGCFNTQVNTIVQVSGFDAVVAGIALSCASAGMFVGKILLGWIKDKVNATVAVLVGCIFGVVAFALFIMSITSANVMMLYVGALLAGFCICLGSVGPPLLTADAFGPKDFGSILGIMTALNSVGMVIGTPVYSGVFDSTGSYLSMLIALIVLTVIVFVLCFAGIKNCQSKWKVPPAAEKAAE